jgi:diacylglycerol kinase (ATP)
LQEVADGQEVANGKAQGCVVPVRDVAAGASGGMIELPEPIDAIVLHNPDAGMGDLAAEELLAALASGGIEARYCCTKAPGFPDAVRQPADLIVSAGGDGTLVKIIHRLRDRTGPIAILPSGGANNIAGSLGIDIAPLEIARADWRRLRTRRLDIATAAGPWGKRLVVEGVGMGALAEALAAVDEMDVRGSERLRMARETLCRALAEAEPEEVRLEIDGQALETHVLLAEIMNIELIGPRLPLVPAADPGNGLLDLVYLEPQARADMIAWLQAETQARPRTPPPLATRRGQSLALTWRQGKLHLDDTFFGPPVDPCGVEVEILPDPITVVVPMGRSDGGMEPQPEKTEAEPPPHTNVVAEHRRGQTHAGARWASSRSRAAARRWSRDRERPRA